MYIKIIFEKLLSLWKNENIFYKNRLVLMSIFCLTKSAAGTLVIEIKHSLL